VNLASGRHQTDVDDVTPVIPPDDPGSDSWWSLAGTRPDRLALRLAVAALGVGIVGGVATACLALLFGATDVSPAARILAIELPLVLVAMIGWRLVAATGHLGSPPSGQLLGWVAVASVVLIAVVQGWSAIGGLDDDITATARAAVAVMVYGAVYGLMPAVAATVVLVPALLLLRASRVRIALPYVQVLLTEFAMVVTVAFALWVTTEPRMHIVTGMATALAGTGAALTARWCLVDRRA
jgi:hypothetical protein